MLWSIQSVLNQEQRKLNSDPDRKDLNYSIEPYQESSTFTEEWAFEKLWKILNEKQDAEQIIGTIDTQADQLRYTIQTYQQKKKTQGEVKNEKLKEKAEKLLKVSNSTPWNDIPGMYRHIIEETAHQHIQQQEYIQKTR